MGLATCRLKALREYEFQRTNSSNSRTRRCHIASRERSAHDAPRAIGDHRSPNPTAKERRLNSPNAAMWWVPNNHASIINPKMIQASRVAPRRSPRDHRHRGGSQDRASGQGAADRLVPRPSARGPARRDAAALQRGIRERQPEALAMRRPSCRSTVHTFISNPRR